MLIRPAADGDAHAIWAIMEPILRAGETYCLPRDMGKESALAYWFSPEREVLVAEDQGEIVGTVGELMIDARIAKVIGGTPKEAVLSAGKALAKGNRNGAKTASSSAARKRG